jgi:hypothetical protein
MRVLPIQPLERRLTGFDRDGLEGVLQHHPDRFAHTRFVVND